MPAQGKAKAVLGRLLDDLLACTLTHFAMEEQLMQAHLYPDREQHIKKHSDLKASVGKLQEEFAAGKNSK